VKLLIKAGANVNIANRYSNTPIHIASFNGHYDIVELLVEKRADIMRENYVSKSSNNNK
jgi:ankyrin repeat protein